MAARRKQGRSEASSSAGGSSDAVDQLARISKLLALLAVKGESQEEKVLTLTAAGFSASEIAELLRTTANTVAVTVYKSKQKPKKKAARKKAKSR